MVTAGVRILTLAALLSGCGLIAGLRTDYELSDGGGRSEAGDGASDVRLDAPPGCSDLVKNGNETDIDCGGNQCPKCVINKQCNGDGDCQSGNCSSNRCRP